MSENPEYMPSALRLFAPKNSTIVESSETSILHCDAGGPCEPSGDTAKQLCISIDRNPFGSGFTEIFSDGPPNSSSISSSRPMADEHLSRSAIAYRIKALF